MRAHKREALLAATEINLAKIKAKVVAAKLAGQGKIGVQVGKIVNQYKVAKHFVLDIGEHAFAFQRKHESIAAEAALDGIYIIRTSVSAAQMVASFSKSTCRQKLKPKSSANHLKHKKHSFRADRNFRVNIPRRSRGPYIVSRSKRLDGVANAAPVLGAT